MKQLTFPKIEEISKPEPEKKPEKLTIGQRSADIIAKTMGSWRFLIIQTVILSLWVAFNVFAWVHHWDPYPFILMNLVLSMQAAYAAPVIMMSQNRQEERDREAARHHFEQATREAEHVKEILKHLEAQNKGLKKIHRHVEPHPKGLPKAP